MMIVQDARWTDDIMIKNKPTKNKKSGFTLIEIMVAVSIFALVMVVAIGAVLSIISANKKAQALNSVITNLNFALEGMMRDLRTGYDFDCDLTTEGLEDCAANPGQSVRFVSSQSDGQKVVYGLDGVEIYKQVEGEEAYSLTAPDVTVEVLNFYVSGTAPASSDYRQPKMLVVVRGRYIGHGQDTKFDLQTLVSQRKLDI